LAELAKVLGIKQANFNSSWSFVPEKHLAATAAFLGVPEAELRPDLHPDLYPPEPWSAL
jgi:hypothetical protein